VVLLSDDSSVVFPFTPDTLLTSLAFRRPHCGVCPGCPNFSTAIKLARTLLKGLVFSELSVPSGDRPRLGGDVDWSLEALFSNIARRFRTPEALFEDMTVEGTKGQRLLVTRNVLGNHIKKEHVCPSDMASRIICVQTQRVETMSTRRRDRGRR
jgi:hypothetical protein